jgi:Flp pilus assembly protein TadD
MFWRYFLDPCGIRKPAVVRALFVLSSGLLLNACATRLGYLDHAQPSFTQDSPVSATESRTMYLDLIRQMQQQGAYYASLAHIDAYRQRYGNTPELFRLQADAFRGTGQTEMASKLYESLLDSDQAGPAQHGLGLIASARGENDQAEQALSRAVQIDPLNVTYLGDLGYARLQSGRLSAALEPLAKAAELAPDNVKAVSNLSLWMLLSGNYAQANAMMQRAALPQPARDEIYRLAVQLRSPPQALRPAADATLLAETSRQHTPRQQASPPQEAGRAQPALSSQVVGIPGSMLERFDSTPPSSEVHP